MAYILHLQLRTMRFLTVISVTGCSSSKRISGIVTLIFISWHVWETRIQAMLGKEVNYDMMADILNNPAMFAFYLVGVVSTIFHFANGLWTFCIS